MRRPASGRFAQPPMFLPHRIDVRGLVLILIGVAALAGCAAQREQRRERAPLRDVFAPPSLEAPAPAAASPAPAAETPAPAAATPAPASQSEDASARGADEDTPAAGNSLTLEYEPAAADRPPAQAPVPAEAADAQEAPGPAEPPAARLTLPKEFASPAQRASVGTDDVDAPAHGDEDADPAGRVDPPPAKTEPTPLAIEPAAELPEPVALPEAAAPQPEPSRNAPAAEPGRVPRIILSTRPALLVAVDGTPELGPVEGTKLQRVLNTPAFLLKGLSGYYYLSVYDGFMRAARLDGPWNVLAAPPRVVLEAKAAALAQGEADLLAGRPDRATGRRPSLKDSVPQIIVSTRPAVLIATRGEPAYEPVDGTSVSRLANADVPVFVYRPQDRSYVQVGSRWFSAARLEGPWQAAAEGDVPDDVKTAAAR